MPAAPDVTLALALFIFLCGVVAGGLGALLGIGGGVFLVPFLALVLDVPIVYAIPISLTTVIATSTAVSSRTAGRQLINLRLGMLLETATAAGEAYQDLLRERITAHGASAWLVNTGWTGGPYGTGSRMPIAATRAIVRAAVSGDLDGAPTRTDPVFGFQVPTEVPGVEAALLDPRGTWDDPDGYDRAAADLAAKIREHAAEMRG